MRHAVGRMGEWEAPDIEEGSEEWNMSHHYDNGQLTHRLRMGARKGFGRHRWCRMIQGAYRSKRPLEPLIVDNLRREDAVLTQIHRLQTQLQRLGPYTMYTDGDWEYGGVRIAEWLRPGLWKVLTIKLCGIKPGQILILKKPTGEGWY